MLYFLQDKRKTLNQIKNITKEVARVYNTKNLYDEIDRKRSQSAKEEIRAMRKKSRIANILGYFREYSLIIILIIGVAGFMTWRHDGQIIQTAKDYFENFDNPNYANRGKEPTNYKRDVIVESQPNQQAMVPVIEIQGELKRDGEQFIIFKYNNKEYTQQIGDSFANGKYIITGISKKELEISDTNGNYFYYEIPNRQYIKK